MSKTWQTSWWIGTGLCFAALLLSVGCERSARRPSRLVTARVTRAEMGQQWPLSVDVAEVGCMGAPDAPLLWVEAGGVRYGLSDAALGQPGSFADPHRIVREEPGGTGRKVSLDPLRARAQALCR